MRYLLRFMGFVVKVAAIVAALAVVGLFAFYTAMNLSNIYVLIGDGMEKRASTALMQQDSQELPKFFDAAFIDSDPVLTSNTYATYKITDFEHAVSFQWIWNWPWSNSAKAIVTERVLSIDGSLSQEYLSEEQKAAGAGVRPPAWDNAKYEVRLVKTRDGWRIHALTKLESVADELPSPTPEPSPDALSPTPEPSPDALSPTPEPSAEAQPEGA